jgi:hypothetical protein
MEKTTIKILFLLSLILLSSIPSLLSKPYFSDPSPEAITRTATVTTTTTVTTTSTAPTTTVTTTVPPLLL